MDGNGVLTDTAGNNLFSGGLGTDTLTGNIGNELFIGGAGNDAIATSIGKDIIAFNRGDGQDTVAASNRYGLTGSLANVGFDPAVSILSNPSFGTAAQALQAQATLEQGVKRLS